ncbi:MAG: hypothetical protein BGO41_12095 [Clostridiales bacterium 38-18]|nr:MAG: hypothetical protein BGO41_12095 [Clostridiales bacterium 38-18]
MYKSFACYTRMQENHQDIFNRLVNDYKKELVYNVQPDLYTIHDFEHHTVNIMKILSEIFLIRETSFNSYELFYLNCAALFHDISMYKYREQVLRKNHAIESSKYLDSEKNDKRSSIFKEFIRGELLETDLLIIQEIINAHTNSHMEEGKDSLTTVVEHRPRGEKVEVLKLACIFRLCDELDITNKRLLDIDIENALSETKIEDQVSIDHWQKLYLFENVYNDKIEDTLVLKISSSGIKSSKLSFKQYSYEENCKLAAKVYSKIIDAFQFINKSVLMVDIDIIKLFDRKITILADDPKVTEKINDEYAILKKLDRVRVNASKLVNIELTNDIQGFVIDNNLLYGGHYKINENYCVRDWIDCTKLLQNRILIEKISKVIALDIQNNVYDQNTLIVGINQNGSLIANEIAVKLLLPFTPLYSKEQKKDKSKQETNINVKFKEFSNIIFICDVIITGDTLHDVVTSYSIPTNKVQCYTVFYRKIINEETANQRVQSKYNMKYLNDKNDVEIFDRNKCTFMNVYGINKCINHVR